MKQTKYKIAVSGAAEIGHCVKNVEDLSYKVGEAIAKNGCVIVTGATSGCPYYSAKGANDAGGLSIGFSPAASHLAHKKSYKLPDDEFDLIVYTGFDYSGRNLLMTRAADGLIVICGRIGTLNEFTIAYEDGLPIGILLGSGGTADIIKTLLSRPHKKRGIIIYDTDPEELVKKLIAAIKKDKGRK